MRFSCECGLSFEMKDNEWPLTCLCGRYYVGPDSEPSSFSLAVSRNSNINTGPGTKLELIFTEAQVPRISGCDCVAMITKMNIWGCECWQHRDEIYTHLQRSYKLLDWEQTVASALYFRSQKWFQSLKPLESLLVESLRRAGCELAS